jgi:hypothetical protein
MRFEGTTMRLSFIGINAIFEWLINKTSRINDSSCHMCSKPTAKLLKWRPAHISPWFQRDRSDANQQANEPVFSPMHATALIRASDWTRWSNVKTQAGSIGIKQNVWINENS